MAQFNFDADSSLSRAVSPLAQQPLPQFGFLRSLGVAVLAGLIVRHLSDERPVQIHLASTLTVEAPDEN